MSDFGDHGVYCTKCVPKVAPLQANETVEMERASRAAQMTSEVRAVCGRVCEGVRRSVPPFVPRNKTGWLLTVPFFSGLCKVTRVNEQVRGDL